MDIETYYEEREIEKKKTYKKMIFEAWKKDIEEKKDKRILHKQTLRHRNRRNRKNRRNKHRIQNRRKWPRKIHT